MSRGLGDVYKRQGMHGIEGTDNTRYYVVLNTDKEDFVLRNLYHPNFGRVPLP